MTAILDPSTAAPPRRRRLRITSLLSVTVLTVAAILIVAPLVWALSTSLRTPATSFDQPPHWIPTHPVWGKSVRAPAGDNVCTMCCKPSCRAKR